MTLSVLLSVQRLSTETICGNLSSFNLVVQSGL